jgi:hypothetical protein
VFGFDSSLLRLASFDDDAEDTVGFLSCLKGTPALILSDSKPKLMNFSLDCCCGLFLQTDEAEPELFTIDDGLLMELA